MKNKKSVIKLFFASIPFVLLAFKSTSNKQDTINSAIKTIVIDAGHGGKDPGCHGAASNEKSVCLSIALKLGNAIKAKYPGIKVIYTRDKDVFVELDERAKIANRAKADLFICIHANSASPAAFGSETYVLGLHRTESQAKIADRENSTIYLEADKGEKYKDFDLSPDAIIARQLQLSVFLDQSILFASKLQQEFKKLGRYDRGVKQAGFLVLYKTTMPSVLIETGFLTNPGEEKFLGENDGQIRMANAMFSAFEKYKSDLEGVTSVKNKPIIEEVPEAPKQNLPTTVEPTKELVTFRIQIETSEVKLAKNATRFKGFEVMEYQQDGFFKYTTGQFENDFKAANAYKNELRQKGFPNAFVVAFQNGERINLEKAIKLAEN
jgi:N-acetylmuramoyl-L-alanine amidase